MKDVGLRGGPLLPSELRQELACGLQIKLGGCGDDAAATCPSEKTAGGQTSCCPGVKEGCGETAIDPVAGDKEEIK